MKMKGTDIEYNNARTEAHIKKYGRIGLIPVEDRRFLDIADELSAWRSFLGFVYFITAAALVFSVIFCFVYGIYPVENISINGNDVAVVVNKTGKSFKEGDAVLFKIENRFYCAEFSGKSERRDGIIVKSGDEEVFISDDEIEGRAEFVLFPVRSFGEDASALFK